MPGPWVPALRRDLELWHPAQWKFLLRIIAVNQSAWMPSVDTGYSMPLINLLVLCFEWSTVSAYG